MLKKIFLLLFILAVATVTAIYFLGSSALNKGIKTGVETFGPEVTQTAVRLDEVNLSILSGNGTLTGLYVGNPDGYKNENIFALGQIEIDVDTGSIFSDKIIINKIIIQQPEISYEKTLTSSNIKALLKNIEAFTRPAAESSESPAEETPTEDSASKQVVIKQLVIENGTIFVGLMGVGSSVPLPRIELNDIGEDGNKKSMAEVIDQVLSEVLKSIGPAIAGAGNILGEGGKTALLEGEDTLEKVGTAAGDAVNKASDSIKNLFGK
jgi:hypothetical protein